MTCVLPMGQISPPLGEVTVRLPPPMVKSVSLTSSTVGSVTLVIRMRAWVVALPVTVQLNRPSLAVLAVMSDQEAPPFRET